MTTCTIRRLNLLETGLAAGLAAQSIQEGFHFVERFVEEYESGANRFDRPGEALFGAFLAGELIGICGLNVDPFLGDPRVGRVRRLYVHPAHRRCGVASRLIERVIDAARPTFTLLTLRTRSPAAEAFYASQGFRPDGSSPYATHSLRL